MRYLQAQAVLITGATSGLGRALVKKLADARCKLAFCGRSDEKMKSLVAELKEYPPQTLLYDTFDIADEEKSIDFVRRAEKTYGVIDILINCAGANTARGTVTDIATADLETMLRVNLIAPFVFMREVARGMMKRNAGQIININSTVSLFSNEGIGAYTASKAGFNALTKVFRKEMRVHRVRVCTVYPGGINTPFREKPRDDYLDAESVADSIIAILQMDPGMAVDEFTLRPFIEKNFS